MPEYAKDIKLNLSSMANEETINAQQLWGTFYASALATGNAELINEILEDAKEHLDAQTQEAVKGAATIMAMNNVYYKFTGFMDDTYRNMPAKLRMNIIGNPGVDKVDFDMWTLAVSIINGCKYCVLAHERDLRNHGVSAEQVQTVIRVAAVVRATDATLKQENALAQGSVQAQAA